MIAPLRVRLTAPSAELPLALPEVRAYLGIAADDTASDALLAGYVRSATDACQSFTGRALLTQSWKLVLDAWPAVGRGVTLPFSPLQEVTQIAAYNEIDQATVWTAASYFVDTVGEPGRVFARRFLAGAGAAAASDLPGEAGACAFFQAEQAVAELVFKRDFAQRLDRAAPRA